MALLAAGASALRARAETLDEAAVIRLARQRDPGAAVAREAVAVAAAAELEAALYPNPTLGWYREQLPGSGPQAGSQDTVSLAVPLDFSGRRPAERALARAELASVRASSARLRSDAVVRALDSFYLTLAAERAVTIAQGTLERLEEAARVLGRRHEEGTISGYERDRLTIELELARSAEREAHGRAQRARRELALRLGLEAGDVVLQGELLGDVAPGAVARPASPPSLEALRSAAGEARDASHSAGSAWVPTLSVTGGLRIGVWEDTYYGYVAGVELGLPVFARGQELRARADAGQRLLSAQVDAAEASLRIEAGRARDELSMARDELVRFQAATREGVERLVRAVESGYREGQRSIVELLDAHRARAAVEVRQLELALTARRAELALRAAQGAFE